MNHRTRAVISAAFCAQAGLGLAGCVAEIEPEEVKEAAFACPGTPHPNSCQVAVCDPESRTWEIDPKPAGTPCQRTGTCDGDGHCDLPPPPPPPPPRAPSGTTITARHADSISLAWLTSTGATAYSVAISPVPPGGPASQTTTSTSLTWKPLSNASRYCFTVAASNAGGSTQASPVCAYTSAPVFLLTSFNAGLPPMAAVPPILAARVDSIVVAPSNDLGPTGSVGLLGPLSQLADCARSVILRPGDGTSDVDLERMHGSRHPLMGSLVDGCPFGSAAGAGDILLEYNFTPSPTMHINDATYGGNVGAPIGNATADVRSTALIPVIPADLGGCEGAVACEYTVSTARLGDPVPNQAKDFVAHFTCGSDPTMHVASAPAEADGSVVRLECAPIFVQVASYGSNTSDSLQGNATTDVRATCEGDFTCSYTVSVSRLGDPAPGQAKDFEVGWTCGSDPTLHSFTVPPEANGSVVPIMCP